MGVIDLDARVKKLEADGAGGAVIDQLEAAVTDLEETINGDGETDFGLVGDVAALETAAVPQKTVITSLTGGTLMGHSGDVYYEVLGNLVHIHAAVKELTANTATTLFALPEALRPSNITIGAVNGKEYLSSGLAFGVLTASDSGNVTVLSPGAYAVGDVFYMINSVTPTT